MAINKRLIKSNDEAAAGPSFNTVTYTGNFSTNSITGVGFQPDLVWGKLRNFANAHLLFDSVRGVGNYLVPNLTDAEGFYAPTLTSFDSDGFTLGADNTINKAGYNAVAWCWKAGGAAVTNTDGTITSQVSANTEAGFSIVSWTSTGSVATVGHGLGVAPNIIIAKNRGSSGAWSVYSSELGNTKRLRLNENFAEETNTVWGNTSPTNSVFTQDVTTGTTNIIAYCFAEVAGFSKFGSYSGTGAAGNFQDCGFEPAFIMFKASNQTSDWNILDNKRDTTNPNTLLLNANKSDAEVNLAFGVNFESNGFSFSGDFFNTVGFDFIYMAFANQF